MEGLVSVPDNYAVAYACGATGTARRVSVPDWYDGATEDVPVSVLACLEHGMDCRFFIEGEAGYPNG